MPDENEQVVVRSIVELRRADASYRTIATTLDAEGVKPRKSDRWSPNSVRAIVEREMSVRR